MKELECQVGGLKIVPECIRHEGIQAYDSPHLFVVARAKEGVVSVYVARGPSHSSIAKQFGLRGRSFPGGGSCYLDGEDKLVLNDYSSSFGAIPKQVAQRFAELLVPELEKLGIHPTGIEADPKEERIHPFWEDMGFEGSE